MDELELMDDLCLKFCVFCFRTCWTGSVAVVLWYIRFLLLISCFVVLLCNLFGNGLLVSILGSSCVEVDFHACQTFACIPLFEKLAEILFILFVFPFKLYGMVVILFFGVLNFF